MMTENGPRQDTADVCSTKSGSGTAAAAAAIAGLGSRPNALGMHWLACGRRPVHLEHRPAVREVSGNLMTDTASGAPVIDPSARQQVIERVGFGARER